MPKLVEFATIFLKVETELFVMIQLTQDSNLCLFPELVTWKVESSVGCISFVLVVWSKYSL